MIKKHYLEKVLATRSQNVGKPYKTYQILSFSKCKNALRKLSKRLYFEAKVLAPAQAWQGCEGLDQSCGGGGWVP